MKVVTVNGDISLKLNKIRSIGQVFTIRFYTTDPNNYFEMTELDVELVDGERVLKINWNDIKTLGKGVLNYVVDNRFDDAAFDDGVFNSTFTGTTDYFIDTDLTVDDSHKAIVTFKEMEDAPMLFYSSFEKIILPKGTSQQHIVSGCFGNIAFDELHLSPNTIRIYQNFCENGSIYDWDLFVHRVDPPIIDAAAFDSCRHIPTHIYVPKGQYGKYMSATNWSRWGGVIAEIP